MHHRNQVGAAAALNTAIFVGEAVAGFGVGSLSLVMDALHNFIDQLALVFLYLAFVLPQAASRNLIRPANLLNSVGLLTVSGFLVWHAIQRLIVPTPLQGIVPIATGLLAAAANWGVARLLRQPAKLHAAIRF